MTAAFVLVGCGGGGGARPTSPPPASAASAPAAPLFVRLGGLAGITAVVDQFLAYVKAHEPINARFVKVDMTHLRQMAIDQLCASTGGGPIVGCKYTGKTMVDAHAGMHITDAEFAATVEDLGRALDAAKVPEAEQRELLGGLVGVKGEIVRR
jgi:hemoglobin